jgi:hypothetical protein
MKTNINNITRTWNHRIKQQKAYSGVQSVYLELIKSKPSRAARRELFRSSRNSSEAAAEVYSQ